MEGLIIGTVANNYDAGYPGQVQVTYPSFETEGQVTAWMPIAALYAGKDYGMYMLPEKNEQVLIGFVSGDVHCGVVLGSLWNKKNTIPKNTVDEQNLNKCLITKGGHSIIFSDGDKGKVSVKSKNGHTVEIDEEKKTVKVSTSDGKQFLTLDESNQSVDLVSGDKINIKAKTVTVEGTVSLKGPSVTIKADNELKMESQTAKLDSGMITIKGKTKAELSGAAVDVKSSGILTLKGSMTKIN